MQERSKIQGAGRRGRRLNRKMEQFSSILIDSMQPHPTKDKKIAKSRKRSVKSSAQGPLCSLPLEETGEEGGREQLLNKLEMSNVQLFLWKSQGIKEAYPSVFQLIRLPKMEPSQVTLHHLMQPSFPVLSFKVKDLITFACMMLQSNSFARGLPLFGLFSAIAENYNCVSYHNFSHAFTLMQLNFQCIQREPTLKTMFTDQERFCIAVAALSHDLGHTGTNNHFQVQKRSELARLSNNVAVLEHMHVRTLWRILQERPQINFMTLLPDQTSAKKAITGLILNTDMGSHHAGLTKLKGLHTAPLIQHKWTLMEQLFHACDIGNPCLDYDNYVGWAALLAFEFDAQTHLQEKLGLEVSRGLVYRGLSSLYCDQQWFLGSIVQPLWKEISSILPNLQPYRLNVQSNLKRIKEQTRTCCQE